MLCDEVCVYMSLPLIVLMEDKHVLLSLLLVPTAGHRKTEGQCLHCDCNCGVPSNAITIVEGIASNLGPSHLEKLI